MLGIYSCSQVVLLNPLGPTFFRLKALLEVLIKSLLNKGDRFGPLNSHFEPIFIDFA